MMDPFHVRRNAALACQKPIQRSWRLGMLTVAVCGLILAGCGASSAAGQSGSGGLVSTPTPTAPAGGGDSGRRAMKPCPGPEASLDSMAKADLVLTATTPARTGTVPVGGIVQVRLSSASRWRLDSDQGLELLQPAGVLDSSAGICAWDFRARQAGTATIAFTGAPFCEPQQDCPQHVVLVIFTVKVGG